jgi:DNA-binding response OmpR family regulator
MGQGVRVLVVEDDLHVRRDLADVLEEEGYLVDVASHGLEALERARRALPDVVLLDLSLPVMDGWAFRRELLGLEGGERPRIILVTADLHTSEKASRLGASAYVQKPFDVDELLATVSAVTRAA